MIAIVNISQHDDMFGENEYSLRINKKEIGRFTHIRIEPLSVILRKAAECAKTHETKKFNIMMDAMQDDPAYKFDLNEE